jgi:hypothetical protein
MEKKMRKFKESSSILVCLALIVAVALYAHIKVEKQGLQKALKQLTAYKVKISKQKRELQILKEIRKLMKETGIKGGEKGTAVEATFVVTDFNQFVQDMMDIYYKEGFFFLEQFEEKTALPEEGNESQTEPISIATIRGRKVIGYKP